MLDMKGMIDMLERMMVGSEIAPENNEQVEDMILELHKLTIQTNGNVLLSFR